MSATLTILGLYKSAQISLPLLKVGFKIMRDHAFSASSESEWEKGMQDLLGEQVKELLKGRIDNLSQKQLEAVEAPLVSFTGLVLQSLVQDVLNTEDFASVKAEFTTALIELPQRWKTFVGQGIPEAQPLNNADFLTALQAAHDGDDSSTAISPEWLAAFFSQWIQRDIGLTRQREGWNANLAAAVAPLIGDALSSTLVANHPVAATAFRDSMLRFHTELRSLVKEVITEVKNQGVQSAERDNKLVEVMLELAANQQINNKESRLAAYKRSLLTAFSTYQELAIDNFAAGEQASPDIWDIFVHPACSAKHMRPEDMDVAQRETPPRLPAQDLLSLLARDDHRRTVLLADPGMGKSTLIQSLIAHLANGRAFPSATALTGLLPVPLILRDLVPLLPHDQVESWSWDSLLTVLIEHYQRDETAPPLCDCFKDHRDEFRQLIHSDEAVFFLIDGLDEIGDLTKRRQIAHCIQYGFRVTNKNSHWLITSRVIGYEAAPVDSIDLANEFDLDRIEDQGGLSHPLIQRFKKRWNHNVEKWRNFVIDWRTLEEPSDFIETVTPFFKTTRMPSVFLYSEEQIYLERHQPIAQCLYLAPFDDRRQDLFTQRWFQHRHSIDYSRQLMREVRAHHHDGVRIISRVPNLLCMMNILKRSGKPLPDGRAALYDEIVKAYLGGIDSAYRLRPVLGNTCPFDTLQRRFLLSLLGAEMQETRTVLDGFDQFEDVPKFDGNILISKLNIERILLPTINSMIEEGKVADTHSAAELLDELLHHIATRSGLLIPRSSDPEGTPLYSFSHLSFMEFFTAEWLSLEYDRQRNRIVRKALTHEEGQQLREEDLDLDFPPHGLIRRPREEFKKLPSIPAWHEPLIFLLESRKSETLNLLRWLFPPLYNQQPYVIARNNEDIKPLLPLDAVRLAINLANDLEIPITTATRQQWWRVLWNAQLQWPFEPWSADEPTSWHIAPLLLQRVDQQIEIITALAEVESQLSGNRLYFNECKTLTSAALESLRNAQNIDLWDFEGCTELTSLPVLAHASTIKRLSLQRCTHLDETLTTRELVKFVGLQNLYLDRCQWLSSIQPLAAIKGLEILSLNHCTGLRGPEALQGLRELSNLKTLWLQGCTNLENTWDMATLTQLEQLSLSYCSGLEEADAFKGISGLRSLKSLWLYNCPGLKDTSILASLCHLELLDLRGCTSLRGQASLQGIVGLTTLKAVFLADCIGLTKQDIAWLRNEIGKTCQIIGL